MGEKEIKITLERDCVKITCGDIVAYGDTLTEAIEEFDIELEYKNMFQM